MQDRQLKRDAERLRRDVDGDMTAGFQQIGSNSGTAFGDGFQRSASPRIRKATNAAAEAADVITLKESNLKNVRDKLDGTNKGLLATENQLTRLRQAAVRDTDAEEKAITRLNRQRITQSNLLKQLTKAHVDLNRAQRAYGDKQSALDNLVPKIDTTQSVQQVGRLSSALAGLGSSITPMGAAGVGGVIALGATLVDVAGVAASAAQSLWLLPAAAGAAGAALGTLKLATMGFDQAIKDIRDNKKFIGDLQSLSPEAQQAAMSLRQLLPEFDHLRSATQNSFFSGLSQEINQIANQFGPTVERLTTGIAGAFNGMLKGVGAELLTPETQASIQTFTTNVVSAFQQLAPAMAPVTKALAQIMAAGSGALPQLASEATKAAQAFASFINVHSSNGDLTRWLNEGLNTIKQLVPLAFSLGKSFMDLAPIGQKILPDIVKVLDQVGRVIPEIGAAALLLGPNFGAIGVAAHGVEVAVSAIGRAFHAVESVVVAVVNRIIPVVNSVGQAISNSLGPIRTMIDAANALGAGIPNIPEWSGIPQITDPQQTYGGANAQRERRGATPVPLPTAGLPGFATQSIPGTLGGSVMTPTATGPSWSAPGSPFSSSSSGGSSGGSGGSGGGSQPGILVTPQNALAAIQYAASQSGKPYGYGGLGPGSTSGGPQGLYDCSGFMSDLFAIMTGKPYTGNERFFTTESDFSKLGFEPGYQQGAFNIGIHHGGGGMSSHMAGQLPNGVNVESGPRGTQYGALAADPRDRQFDTQYHLPVSQAFNTGIGAPLPVSVQDISSQAASSMQQELGAKLDADFGVSKGLPGIFENITKLIANLAMAPVLGALSGVTGAYGSAGPGTGLLGALAPRQNAFGQQMPNVLGQFPQSQGSPTPGGWSPIPGAPVTPLGGGGSTPLSGTSAYGGMNTPQSGLGTLGTSNPGASYNVGTPWQLANTTGTYSTPSRGIPLGQGMPQSSGIGFGKGGLTGLIGSAATSAIAMGGMAASMGTDGGAGGAAASAAAQIGIDEINRAISAGSQIVGIGVQGLMETLLPVESQLADPTRGWLGRIVGGVAGVRPVADITAGAETKAQGSGPLTPEAVDKQRANIANTTNGDTNNNTTIHYDGRGMSGDQNVAMIGKLAQQSYAPAGGAGR